MPVVLQLSQWLRRLEDALLVALLAFMIGLGCAQILLRNLFDAGFTWGDSLLRVLVLWAALVGAMVATRDDRHIRIDFLYRRCTPRVQAMLARGTRTATAMVAWAMAYYSMLFVIDERDFGLIAFGDVPAWWCETIIPLAFGVIGLRYLLLAARGT